MNINIKELAENCPDVAGELLRELFFKQNLNAGKLGCYNAFKLKDVLKEYTEPIEPSDEKIGKWNCALKNLGDDNSPYYIVMKYYWDGDGELIFEAQNWSLVNGDCKKTNGWEFIELEE